MKVLVLCRLLKLAIVVQYRLGNLISVITNLYNNLSLTPNDSAIEARPWMKKFWKIINIVKLSIREAVTLQIKHFQRYFPTQFPGLIRCAHSVWCYSDNTHIRKGKILKIIFCEIFIFPLWQLFALDITVNCVQFCYTVFIVNQLLVIQKMFPISFGKFEILYSEHEMAGK